MKLNSQVAKRRCRALIFDMGDILYDASQWRRWLHVELSKLGFSGTFQDLVFAWETKLVPVYEGRQAYDDAYRSLLEDLVPDVLTREAFHERSLAAKQQFESEQRRPFPGVRETLKELRAAGLKLAVLSDNESSSSVVRARLGELGLEELFHVVLTSKDIGHAKPDARAYLAVLKELQLSPEEAVFVAHDQDELDGADQVGLKAVAWETTGSTVRHETIPDFRDLVLVTSSNRYQ